MGIQNWSTTRWVSPQHLVKKSCTVQSVNVYISDVPHKNDFEKKKYDHCISIALVNPKFSLCVIQPQNNANTVTMFSAGLSICPQNKTFIPAHPQLKNESFLEKRVYFPVFIIFSHSVSFLSANMSEEQFFWPAEKCRIYMRLTSLVTKRTPFLI